MAIHIRQLARTATTVVLLFFLVQVLYSQDEKKNKKMVHSIGAGAFSGYYHSPVKLLRTATDTTYLRITGLNWFSFYYRSRFNIVEFGDNAALGLNLVPSLGIFGFNQNGISLNLPMMLGIDFSAGSTYSSIANHGGFIHAGYELNKLIILTNEEFSNTPEIPNYQYDDITYWAEPVVCVGIRYWGKMEILQEANLKLGWGKQYSFKHTSEPAAFSVRAMDIRLNYFIFLNY